MRKLKDHQVISISMKLLPFHNINFYLTAKIHLNAFGRFRYPWQYKSEEDFLFFLSLFLHLIKT